MSRSWIRSIIADARYIHLTTVILRLETASSSISSLTGLPRVFRRAPAILPSQPLTPGWMCAVRPPTVPIHVKFILDICVIGIRFLNENGGTQGIQSWHRRNQAPPLIMQPLTCTTPPWLVVLLTSFTVQEVLLSSSSVRFTYPKAWKTSVGFMIQLCTLLTCSPVRRQFLAVSHIRTTKLSIP